MQEFDLAVIGSGVGLSLVDAALQNGMTCALVEEGKFGGTCLTRGCIPSKILVHPADLIREAAHAAKTGLHFRLAGVDWPLVAQRMWEKIDGSTDIESSLDGIAGLTVFKGTGSFTGSREMRVSDADGSVIDVFRAQRFILAPGARSSVPPIEGLEETGYVISESFFGDSFPDKPWKSLVILGGGAIGTEFAHIFSAFGTRVTIVEMMPHLISTEELEIREHLENRFRENGIKVLTGHRAVSARADGDGKILTVRDDETGETRDLPCEEILVSSGVRSNADRMRVENAEIATDKRGWIVTDEYLQTSVPGIYALGDVNGKFQFRHKANHEADILAGNLFGHSDIHSWKPIEYSSVPWAIFTHPQIAHVGMTEEQASVKGRRLLVGYNRYSSVAKGFAMGYEAGDPDDGFIKMIVDENRLILGVHIVGPHAAILIQSFVYLMNAGFSCSIPPTGSGRRKSRHESIHTCPEAGTIDPVSESMVIHPSLSELAGWVIGNLEWREG